MDTVQIVEEPLPAPIKTPMDMVDSGFNKNHDGATREEIVEGAQLQLKSPEEKTAEGAKIVEETIDEQAAAPENAEGQVKGGNVEASSSSSEKASDGIEDPQPSGSNANSTPLKGSILQLKVSLKYTRPKIWRRIQVVNTDTFYDLQNYIKNAMGWMSTHLHQFIAKSKKTKKNIFIVTDEDDEDFAVDVVWKMFMGNRMRAREIKERKVKLSKYFTTVGDSVIFVYDFGDNWVHEVVLEDILPPPSSEDDYPKCLAGKRACPPEDCGGVTGYKHLLEVFRNPQHIEYDELIRDWLLMFSPGFDPEKFQAEGIFERE